MRVMAKVVVVLNVLKYYCVTSFRLKHCSERAYAASLGYFKEFEFAFGTFVLCSFADISVLPILLELEKHMIGRIRFLSICLSLGLWYVPDSCSIGMISKAFFSCFRMDKVRVDIRILKTMKASAVS